MSALLSKRRNRSNTTKSRSKRANNFWENVRTQKDFVEHLGRKLGISNLNDWYHVRVQNFNDLGGAGLLKRYGGSLIKMLHFLYPNHNWQPWRFEAVSRHFWKDSNNLVGYLRWLSEQLGISTMRDWKCISYHQIKYLKGSVLLSQHKGVLPLLRHCFPDIDSIFLPTSTCPTKSQQFLYNIIAKLFQVSQVEMKYNYKHPLLNYSCSKKVMELDIFLPSTRIAFEFQGIQHFKWSSKYGSSERVKLRDLEKRTACDRFGITLIGIPYSWKGDLDLIASEIQTRRPDLVCNYLSQGSSTTTILYENVFPSKKLELNILNDPFLLRQEVAFTKEPILADGWEWKT